MSRLERIEDDIFNSELPDEVLNELLDTIQTSKELLEGHPDRLNRLKQLAEEVQMEFNQKS